MAKRPSVKEILELARQGGAAKPAEQAAEPAEAAAVEEVIEAAPETAPKVESEAPARPAADVPTPAKLGRPLTLKEKLAAARAGGPPAPSAPSVAAKAAPAEPSAAEAEPEAAAVEAEAKPAVPPPAPSLGRPMTLKEKLAAARSGGGSPAPAAPKTAAAKPAAAPAAKAAAARVLPPLEKITDPKDLAEALRQTGAKKAKEAAASAAAKAAEAEGATPAKAATAAKAATRGKESKPQSVLPKPAKGAATAAAAADMSRRGFFVGSFFVSWIVFWIALGWSTFTLGCLQFTAMCGRFMFPNVLAEPPSTIKVGLPTNFEPEEVSERFKAEWGFWIVRSSRYNGADVIYALQSVCTHLGCPPNWLAGEQKFKCPCHGSGFYISGINFEGPAPRPLERFKVSISDDGQMVVDKSQKFQQELGQWSDPDSYLNA